MAGKEVGKKLYYAAAQGDLNTIQPLLQQDPYLLDLVSFPCSRNLLHIATMHGQLGIVEEILRRNPQLTGWHVENASKLEPCARKMLWSRDGQGMNPIHVAAMNGHAKILKMLVGFDQGPAKERVDRGQTALHLCVKHGQLEALKVLVENVEELVLVQDDDGETVLHFAVRYKQVGIIQYLMKREKVDKKSKNSKGETAREILLKTFPDPTSSEVIEIRDALRQQDFNLPHEIMTKISDVTMIVVVLIATMAYQSAVSPPGGVWQEDSWQHRAGEAVMASNHPKLYDKFAGANTTAFVSSLISIFMLSTGAPSKNIWLLMMVMNVVWVSLASIAVSYGASLTVITPQMEPQSLDKVINTVVAVSTALYVFLFVLAMLPWINKVTRKPRLQLTKGVRAWAAPINDEFGKMFRR